MPGGMLMQKDCDGYGGSPQECQRAEYIVDRIASLQAAIQCLETVVEVCEEEGLYLHGNLKEMQGVLSLAIRGIEDSFLEGE